jgi:hypothetical protein
VTGVALWQGREAVITEGRALRPSEIWCGEGMRPMAGAGQAVRLSRRDLVWVRWSAGAARPHHREAKSRCGAGHWCGCRKAKGWSSRPRGESEEREQLGWHVRDCAWWLGLESLGLETRLLT